MSTKIYQMNPAQADSVTICSAMNGLYNAITGQCVVQEDDLDLSGIISPMITIMMLGMMFGMMKPMMSGFSK